MKKEAPTYLKLKGVRFATTIHDEPATIVAQDNVVMLHLHQQGAVVPVPPDCNISWEMFDQDVTVTVRDITNEVILTRGEDDAYEEELLQDDKILPVDNWDEILDRFQEEKLRCWSKASSKFSNLVAGLAATCLFAYLRNGTGFWSIVAFACAVVGVTVALFTGLLPTLKILSALNTDILADSHNNYINVKTGRTNLNGGMVIPLKDVK